MDLTLAHRPQSTVYSPKGQVDILPATRVFVRRCSLTFLVPHQRASLPIRSLLVGLTLIVMAISAPRMAAQKVDLSIDASKPGAKIDRNLFGQFAEHLGHGIYDGIWVGSDSTIPNTRGIRNDVGAALKAIDLDRPQSVRAVRRASRTWHLRRYLGRFRFHNSEHTRHPQRRGCRTESDSCAKRTLARRLLRRRISLARRDRAAASREAEPRLGRRDRAEHFWDARIHGLHRPDR